MPDYLAHTVGELLDSIAHCIEIGDTHTALKQARECRDHEPYASIPLPPDNEEGTP